MVEIPKQNWGEIIPLNEVLPRNVEYQLHTVGKEHVVFRCEGKTVSETPDIFALKINWHTLLRPEIDTEEVFKIVNLEYDTISNWYREIEGLIPDESHEIITTSKSPIPQKPFLVVTQRPFYEGPLSDVFVDFSPEELVQVLASDEKLKKDFTAFSVITLVQVDNHKRCSDIDGDGNLLITEKNKLIFVDPHNIFSGEDIDNKENLPKRIEQLRTMLPKLRKQN